MNWESQFTTWAQGPSKTEQEKCERAEDAIRKAIQASSKLSQLDVRVFAQGSYKNRTNIRLESDVDINVCCYSSFFAQYPENCTKDTVGNIDSSYTYSDFKNQVQEALVSYFGADNIRRGSKAFDVHANTYRVDADVVPTMEHRRYFRLPNGSFDFRSGVEIRPDGGKAIINWPEENYLNGIKKRNDTAHRYKKVIRIFKNLRNKMQSEQVSEASNIASFLIECLIWNVPNPCFGYQTLTQDVRQAIISIFTNTKEADKCSEWGEVNELKYLFRSGQPWTREQANAFILACWKYLGFKNE